MNINERMDFLMKKLGHNPNSFAVELGFANPVIYNIVGGRKSKPSYDLLNAIKMRYPEVNLNWLVSNDGEMEGKTTLMEEPLNITYKAKNDHQIPVFPFQAAANALQGIEANEPLEITDFITLPKWMLKGGQHVAVQVRGLSMQNVLQDGSYVIIRKLDPGTWSQFKNGFIHLVYTKTYGAQIKFLRRSERNPNFLIMESENTEENPPIHINFSEILQLWEVDMSLNFRFNSIRKTIIQKINALEMAYSELTIGFDQLKEKCYGLLGEKK